MKAFTARIQKIGINPYLLVPPAVLKSIFNKAGKYKGAVPVKLRIGTKDFIQTMVKYSGKWRLYLNAPMRNAAGKEVGDLVTVHIDFDVKPRTTPIHPKLKNALKENKAAKLAFDKLTPSRQKEILKYLNFLKSEESIDKNVQKTISVLTGNKAPGLKEK